MTSAIPHRFRNIRPDRAQGQHLAVLPILGPSHDQPPYELLRPQTQDKVKVTEVDPTGSVPVLRVENTLDVRVFLMDGQELIGAKQNRILNTDVLVPASATITIPVSCVEQGRWRDTSFTFSAGRTASHRTRSAKLRRVLNSLQTHGTHDANQRAVWKEVAMTLISSRITSATAALHDAYMQREKDLAEFRQRLTLPQDAVGVAVFQAGRFMGLDLFDRHSTLRHYWEVLVDGYAIDLLHGPPDPSQTPQAQAVTDVLDQVQSGKWEPFKSPGEGTEWRLADEKYSAAALVWEDSVVLHLQVFPRDMKFREQDWQGTGDDALLMHTLGASEWIRRALRRRLKKP